MTRRQTVFGEKLAAKGVLAINVKFQIAIAEFQNKGGQYGVALAMLNAAYGRGGGGQSENADDAGLGVPSSSPTNAAKGLRKLAEKAGSDMPDAAPYRDGRGRLNPADRASSGEPPPVSTRHKPGHAKRGLAVTQALTEQRMQSLFDTIKLPDGRRLRDVRWRECPELALRYRRLSRILMAVHGHAIPADPETTIDNVVTEDKLGEITLAVELINDIH